MDSPRVPEPSRIQGEQGREEDIPESVAPAPGFQPDGPEEIDVAWVAYSSRALVPSFVVYGLWTVLIVCGALVLGAWRGTLPGRIAANSLLGALWLVQIGLSIYRMLAIQYWLTTRRLFVERGFRHPGQPGIELAQIRQVFVVRNWVERRLGIGRVGLLIEERARPLVLDGLRHPELFAVEIRRKINAQ
jgi:hypothetical protein